MMTAHRCEAPGCGRFVRAGASHCRKHEIIDVGDVEPDAFERARARFQEHLERGEYEGLLEENVSQIMAQAARAMFEKGLTEEIGALRYALMRLLAEERDPGKLAGNVARVASVAVQVARTQRAINGDTAQGLTSALTQILAELDEG